MADALGTPGGVVSDEDHRLALAGLIAPQSSSLAVRTGVMWGPGSTAIVTGTSTTGTMTVNVAAHHWVTTRGAGDGVYVGTKETSTVVPVGAAPGANSWIVVVYSKQNDAGSSISPDGSTGELYGTVTGAAAASPTKPAIPLGAIEIATVQIASTATNTLGAGVTITNTAALTVARGAPIPVRNTTERNALTTYPGLHVVRMDNGGKLEYWISGTTWGAYDAIQLPVRARRLAATAGGTLSSGSSVNIVAAQTLPGSPMGSGVDYLIRVRGQIQTSIPPGLGATLSATVGGVTYEIDRFTNAGSTGMTYTLRGDDVFPISGSSPQTVSVFVTALAGTITVLAVGSLVIETMPKGTAL